MNEEMRKFIISPCADDEMERRWNAASAVMAENGLDYLVISGRTDYTGGYIKWFTDLPALHDYVAYAIFSVDKKITLVWSGPDLPQSPNPPAYCLRANMKALSRPFIPILNYSNIYASELICDTLKDKGRIRVGLVGQAFMPVQAYKHLIEHLNNAQFVDADNLIDQLKAIKSDEEIKMIRQCCHLQDQVIEYMKERIVPGKRELDIFADIKYKCFQLGAENLIIMVGSNEKGKAAPFYYDHFHGNRVIGKGDTVTILVECNCSNGMYAHIGRIYTLGAPSDALMRDFEAVKEVQKFNLNLLKPGADCAEIWELHNRYMRDHGFPEETRIYTHGQGYDLVERPCVYPDEAMRIQKNMNICPHPTVFSEKTYAFVCENYIIGQTPDETYCLHETPKEIIQL